MPQCAIQRLYVVLVENLFIAMYNTECAVCKIQTATLSPTLGSTLSTNSVIFGVDYPPNKGIGDAGSTADIKMLLSAIVCYSLPW